MGNVKKTLHYLKRNGVKNTYYAVKERLLNKKGVPYEYVQPDESELAREREWFEQLEKPVLFSILVPLYETPDSFLREMIDSCLAQTYGNFELVLADASATEKPGQIVNEYNDIRIKYVHLKENRGISGNTNAALEIADGDYCVLLDHDDLLTPDALYENAKAIYDSIENGVEAAFLYSDEDKTDFESRNFFEPHIKEKLNLDLLLSNNYICHLSVLETSLIKSLEFRAKFDGSQDYDLFLRAIGKIKFTEKTTQRAVIHIPKVLYHWRCHSASTAFDPSSKEYAYVAGKKAIEEFVNTHFGKYEVTELAHKGFYRVSWKNRIFEVRSDVGAVGGMLIHSGRVLTGIYNEDGSQNFAGMNSHFSGYMNRASLQQQVYGLDVRTVKPSKEDSIRFAEIISALGDNPSETDFREASLQFAAYLSSNGRVMIFDPKYNKTLTAR